MGGYSRHCDIEAIIQQARPHRHLNNGLIGSVDDGELAIRAAGVEGLGGDGGASLVASSLRRPHVQPRGLALW